MKSYLLVGSAAAAMALFGPVGRVAADPYVVTSTVPSPPAGYTMGGYENNSNGGILVQLMDGANFVGAAHGLSVNCVSGCAGAGTTTAILLGGTNTIGYVNQGAQGTNTSPWFVSPGTSTFPVSGTVTAIPGAGTGTVTGTFVCASGCSAGSGTATTVPLDNAAIVTGTATAAAVLSNFPTTTVPWGEVTYDISVLGSAGNVVSAQEQINGNWYTIGTATAIGIYQARMLGTSFRLNETTYVGGTTTANAVQRPAVGAVTVAQDPSNPWGPLTGTTTVAAVGTVTAIPGAGTGTVVVAGASQPPLTGTTTVVLNSNPTVNQGTQGTNTSPWFVSPGTSTFPVSGTVTAIPGAGTGTVALTGTGTVAIAGTATVTTAPADPGAIVTGTATAAAVISNFPIASLSGWGEVEWDISALGSAGNIVSAQEQVNGTWYTVGTAGAVGVYQARVVGTAFRLNETTYIGGTTTADAIPRWAHGQVAVLQDPTNPWGPLTGTTTVAVSGTVPITGVLTGTSTVAVANTPAVTISGTATTTEPNVNANPGAASTQDVNVQSIGAVTVGTGQITCGTTATVLVASRATRQVVIIENVGTGTTFIGGVSVTTAGGMLIPPIQGASITLPTTAAIDCIGPANDVVSYIELY